MKRTRMTPYTWVVLATAGLIVIWFLLRQDRIYSPSQDGKMSSTPTAGNSPADSLEITPAGTPHPKIPASKSPTPQNVVNLVFAVAGLSLPITFEFDESAPIPKALQQIMAKDFTLIYGHLDRVEVLTFDPRQFRVDGRQVPTTKRIQLQGKGRYFPDIYRNNFEYIVQLDGIEKLIVTKELIDAYRKVAELRAAYPVAAEALDQFAAKLESTDPNRFAGLQATDLIWAPNLDKAEPAMWQHTQREVQKLRLRRPSFLEFYTNDGKPNAATPMNAPAGSLVASAMTVDEGGIPTGYWPLIYLDGKWRIAVVDM